jgi:hypothetical protein
VEGRHQELTLRFDERRLLAPFVDRRRSPAYDAGRRGSIGTQHRHKDFTASDFAARAIGQERAYSERL